MGEMSTHPGPASVHVPADLIEAIVDHARAGYPLEACGVITGDRTPVDEGRALRFIPLRNAAQSRLRFDIDPMDLLALDEEMDGAGEIVWAIVHSHVASPAYPSPTDVRATELWRNQVHIVVSLAEDEPTFGVFRIVDGEIHPVELLVGES